MGSGMSESGMRSRAGPGMGSGMRPAAGSGMRSRPGPGTGSTNAIRPTADSVAMGMPIITWCSSYPLPRPQTHLLQLMVQVYQAYWLTSWPPLP